MNRYLVALLGLTLCACSYDAKWTDITGQARTEAAAQADSSECQIEAAYPTDRNVPNAEYVLAAERFRNCMRLRGWKMDRS